MPEVMEEPAAAPVTEIIDGYICDAETGEVLGLAEEPEQFRVQDEDSCNWVLKLMLNAEAELIAIDNSPEVLAADAVLRNAAEIRKKKQKKLDWLHKRFDAELGEFAKQQLEGKKERTFKTILGSIALRVVRGGLRVADELAAIRWAYMAAPEAVKVTEKFLISEVPADTKEVIALSLKDPDSAAPSLKEAFALEPDRETIKITTGVAK